MLRTRFPSPNRRRPDPGIVLLLALLIAGSSPSALSAASFPIATTAELEMCLGLAFDGTNYLVGIRGDATDSDAVGAQLVSQSGTLVGGLIPTGRLGGAPSVAWDGSNYLLIWQDCGSPCNNDLLGAFISPAGTAGTPFQISGEFEEIGGLAFDGSNYLVVYFEDVNPPLGDSRAFGRLVSTGGTVGSAITISSGFADFGLNNVAFDGTNFLVVWVDDANDFEVRGRFVSTSGSLGTEFSINSSPAASDDFLTVAFDGEHYLVVWADQVSALNWNLFGQLVDTAGNLVGGVIDISTAPLRQLGPFIAIGASSFLVTWTDARNDLNSDFVCDGNEGSCLDLYGRFVSPAGTLVGEEISITTDSDNQWASPVELSPAGFLVTWINGGQPFEIGGDVFGDILPDHLIFTDGFESGDTSAWSGSMP